MVSGTYVGFRVKQVSFSQMGEVGLVGNWELQGEEEGMDIKRDCKSEIMMTRTKFSNAGLGLRKLTFWSWLYVCQKYSKL